MRVVTQAQSLHRATDAKPLRCGLAPEECDKPLTSGLTRRKGAVSCGSAGAGAWLGGCMNTHVILIGVAAGLGIVAGFGAQVALKVLAFFSLLAGPGLSETLNRAAERPELFWTFGFATALGFALIFYLVWGVSRWVGRARRKDQP